MTEGCPYYVHNVHDRGDDSMCKKYLCEIKDIEAEEHAKHQWIPVTERLPEECGHYLIYVIGKEFKQWSMVTMAYYHKQFYYDDMENLFGLVTHWMPLPEPPKDGEA